MRGTKVNIREPPPSFGLAKYKIDPAGRLSPFNQRHQPARRQQRADVCHGLAQITCGMDDIGRDDQVELAGRESLSFRWLLDVEQGKPQKRMAGKSFTRVFEEQLGEIRE